MSFLGSKSGGGRRAPAAEAPQLAALCYRATEAGTKVLLITSRDTGRWVIPKGWPIDGHSAEEAAQREAYEEAGVRGKIIGEALGSYGYLKGLEGQKPLPCRVLVFALRVDEMADDFPERGQRKLKWFSPKQAARKVQEEELRTILSGFRPPA